MFVNDTSSKRKAFSARKSVDCHENVSSDNEKTFLKRYKSSGSASNLSTRAKYDQQKKYFDSLLSNFSQECLKIESVNDKKTFLHSSKVLEKLNKIIKILTKVNDCNKTSCQLEENTLSCQVQLSLKKVIFYRDILKRLLKERCSIILNEDCYFCIKQTQKLVDDLKHLYLNEKGKIKSMPVQTFNRFIDSSDVNINVLKFMLKRIKMVYDLYFSLRYNSYNVINISRGLNTEVFQTLIKTVQILNNLKLDLIYWTKKIMNVFLKKVCLADSNAISPEYLQEMLKIYDELNLMLQNKYVMLELFQNTNGNSGANDESRASALELMMQYLSHYEAKVASERIVHFLVSDCKRNKFILKRKSVLDDDVNNFGDTSDYCSANASDFGGKYSGFVANANADASVCLLDLLCSLIQRNQTLVLKYLYCMSNLRTLSSRHKKSISGGGSGRTKSFQTQDENSIFLEDKYWLCFWSKLQKFILLSFSEVPYHQYGDGAAGIMLLWPELYLCKVSEVLKITMINEDISNEGRSVIKQIHDAVWACSVQVKWDKKFSSALSAMHLHLCTPVPTALNGTRTYTGNLFCHCVELMMQLICNDIHSLNSFLHLKLIQQLQVTLDSFILWTSTKTRALVSGGNLSTYLVICCFDCKTVLTFLEDKSSRKSFKPFTAFIPIDQELNNIILKQTESVEGYFQDAPNLINSMIFASVRKHLLDALKLKMIKRSAKGTVPSFNMAEHILMPLNEVINNCKYSIVSSVVLAVSQAFLSVLCIIKKNISSKNIQIIDENFGYFMSWFFHLKLSEKDASSVQNIPAFRKLNSIIKLLKTSNSQKQNCLICHNRVSPSELSEVHSEEDQILNEEERIYWNSLHQKICFICC